MSLKKIGVVFQSNGLFDSLTIWENIAFSLLYAKKTPIQKAKDIAYEKMHAVGLASDKGVLLPWQLSGGMQKRVALARALCLEPEILVFDEPTAGLDPISSAAISHLIAQCACSHRTTSLVVTHDMIHIKTLGRKAYFLAKGVLLWEGLGPCFSSSPLRRFLESPHPFLALALV